VNMEAMYNSVALDIIGKAVFNFDFQSVENTSPIIDAVYGLMQVCGGVGLFCSLIGLF
jgi:beta-ring hydroxylase